jgi:diguanylate cyclase (GGDEF)-like protein
VGRWGGEEFLLVLPDTDQAGGLEVAEKIRLSIAGHRFAHGQLDLGVTVTLGVYEYEIGTSVESCVARADEALYRGKANGRNRVEAAEHR